MKIFITGASGFVGSNIIDKLVKTEHEVYSLVRKFSSILYLNPYSKVIVGSLEDLLQLQRLKHQIDVVIHVAGLVAAKNKKDLYKVNVEGTRNLIDFFSNSTSIKHFIYVSSQTASGPTSLGQIKNESAVDSPITQYGRSKLKAEQILIDSSLPYTILRPTAIFGPRDEALLDLIKMAFKGYHVQVGKNKKISLCYINDFANLVCDLVNQEPKNDKYFIASYPAITFEYFNSLVYEFSKKKIFSASIPPSLVKIIGFMNENVGKHIGLTSVFDRDKAKDLTAPSWEISFEKAKNELNYKPTGNIKSDLESTLLFSKLI